MSKSDLLIFHEAMCFIIFKGHLDDFENFLKRNFRGNPEVYNDFISGKSPTGHNIIGRIVEILQDMEKEHEKR